MILVSVFLGADPVKFTDTRNVRKISRISLFLMGFFRKYTDTVHYSLYRYICNKLILAQLYTDTNTDTKTVLVSSAWFRSDHCK